MKILIVDDDEVLATFIKEIIKNEGYRVKTAINGAEGYSAYLRYRPDIIITDIKMPGKNGFELVRTIRMHNPRIRTIYMSGDLGRFRSLLEDEKKRCQASFLTKPFSKLELVGLLSETMS